MPSKRLVSIDFFRDYDLATCVSIPARLFYEALWCLADDQGVLKHDVPTWKIEIFPWDGAVSFDTIITFFGELEKAKRAVVFTVGVKTYVWLPKMLKNQPGLAKICKLFPPPPADLQVQMLGEDGAQEYQSTIQRIDARRDAAKKRAESTKTGEAPAKKPSEKPAEMPTEQPTGMPAGDTRIPIEVLRAAEQHLVRPPSSRERMELVAALSTSGVKPEWFTAAFSETAKTTRSISYACAIVKRWAVDGLPTPASSNGIRRVRDDEDRSKWAELPAVYKAHKA